MTYVAYDNIIATTVYQGDQPLPPVVNAPNGPFAAGSRPAYRGTIHRRDGTGLPLATLLTLTLTIADTLTGEIINSVDGVDILNTGRGLILDGGSFVITLEAADTSMDNVPGASQVQRSLIIEWTTSDPDAGRHQVNLILVRLAA